MPKLQRICCAYYGTAFMPTKRFSHIYCSGSCRTLACRQRRNGISGTLQDKSKSTSVTDLYHSQEILFSNVNDILFAINLRMQELTIMTNEIKYAQKPELIKDIDRKIDEWHSKGMSAVPEQMQAMKLDLFKIQLSTQGILKKQNTQQLITIISSLFGPILGKKIWDGIQGLVSDEKVVPLDDKINAIIDFINKLEKKE